MSLRLEELLDAAEALVLGGVDEEGAAVPVVLPNIDTVPKCEADGLAGDEPRGLYSGAQGRVFGNRYLGD